MSNQKSDTRKMKIELGKRCRSFVIGIVYNHSTKVRHQKMKIEMGNENRDGKAVSEKNENRNGITLQKSDTKKMKIEMGIPLT